MKQLMTGNHAAAHAVRVSQVQVIAAYPITPQTTIVEKLADMAAEGQITARMIRVESEHSALAACMGASLTGARVFTATSSQGLAYQHELLHWTTGTRLPIVIVNANRALAAPWNLGVDHLDSLSQRDTGWMQFYCQNNQEVFDTIIQAYRISEAVHLPTLVAQDGFFLSHTTEMVDITDSETVARFLPPRQPLFRITPDDPAAYNGTTTGPEFTQFRYNAFQAMRNVPKVAQQTMSEFEKVFGRSYGLIDTDHMEGAEIALVTMGSIAGTIRQAIKDLRANGVPVGLVRIRMFRPFPEDELRSALDGVRKIAVIDRDVSVSTGGIVYQEVKSALYGSSNQKERPVFGFIAGLGGSDLTLDRVHGIVDYVKEHDTAEREPFWVEVRQ